MKNIILIALAILLVFSGCTSGEPKYTNEDFCKDQNGIVVDRAGDYCDIKQPNGTYIRYDVEGQTNFYGCDDGCRLVKKRI